MIARIVVLQPAFVGKLIFSRYDNFE